MIKQTINPQQIRYITVHTAKADAHHFLLGASIVKYRDMWVCAYGQSMELENDSRTRFACKYSFDNCATWSNEVEIAGVDGDHSHSHGILFKYGDRLLAYCPRANYEAGNFYPDLRMEAYSLSEDLTWKFEGVALQDTFWPLCEPMLLDNGDLLIAGLSNRNAGHGRATPAVALASGNDPFHWKMVTIPNPEQIKLWGETSVIDYGNRLAAFIRTPVGKAAISESFDHGKSWTPLAISQVDAANAKIYGGTLRSGDKYLIYNFESRKNMIIALGECGKGYAFPNVHPIRQGYRVPPAFLNNPQWAYPYAVEEDGNLYVVYSENKENCELAIIPLLPSNKNV